MCLNAMAIVYGRHHEEIGPFHDTIHMVNMMEKTMDRLERDRLLLFLNKLFLNRENAHVFTQSPNGVKILVDLLPLAHLHTSRAVVNNMSTAIEANPDSTKENQEKEWYYASDSGQRLGPVSFAELTQLYEDKAITVKTQVWAQGLEKWKAFHQVSVTITHRTLALYEFIYQLRYVICYDIKFHFYHSKTSLFYIL
jgi:DnaJ family protein C protein 13